MVAPLAGFSGRSGSGAVVLWMLERVRTGAGPLAHTNYLPPASGIQSGQGQGDSEGRVHAGVDGSNLGVKQAFWAPSKHCQLVG